MFSPMRIKIFSIAIGIISSIHYHSRVLAESVPSPSTLLSRHRLSLLDKARALPKVLLSMDWIDRKAVMEMYSLLHRWDHPSPIEALQLLDCKFPDPKVNKVKSESY